MAAEEKHAIAVKYAWDWFSYHAGQRLTAFRYYLVIIGLVVAGYLKAFELGWEWASWVLAGFGALISLAFLILDIRNTELVNCGRAALDTLEGDLGVSIRQDDKERKRFDESLDWISRSILCLFGFRKGKELRNTWRDSATRHQFWLRFILYITLVGFIWLVILTKTMIELTQGNVAQQAMRKKTERLLVRVGMVEGKMRETMLIKSVVGEGSPVGVVGGQVNALVVLISEVLEECRRGPGVEPFCGEYERWHQSAVEVFQPIGRATKPSFALRDLAKDNLQELERRLRDMPRSLGRAVE